MTQEQIKRAANSYIDDFLYNHIDYTVIHDNYETGRNNAICEFGPDIFKAGAQWRINSVWHDMEEKPNFRGLPILLEHKKGQIHFLDETPSNWNYVIKYYIRWAYVVDLLPADSE